MRCAGSSDQFTENERQWTRAHCVLSYSLLAFVRASPIFLVSIKKESLTRKQRLSASPIVIAWLDPSRLTTNLQRSALIILK